MHIGFLRHLRNAVRSKPHRNGDTKFSYFFTRRSSTPVDFGPGHLNKGQCDNTAVSSIHFASLVCQRNFVIKLGINMNHVLLTELSPCSEMNACSD